MYTGIVSDVDTHVNSSCSIISVHMHTHTHTNTYTHMFKRERGREREREQITVDKFRLFMMLLSFPILTGRGEDQAGQ